MRYVIGAAIVLFGAFVMWVGIDAYLDGHQEAAAAVFQPGGLMVVTGIAACLPWGSA